LNHPNIVTIYDAGEHDGIFYIAMEFIEGTTLHELMAERRVLGADEVIQLTRQISCGLDYAHSNGIIHRDVKPANIMITPNGTVKIMDFGIAKSGGSVTNTGQIMGTPNYMSPEQVKGRPLDGRADLFSMGVILYEMLTGEKPFAGQNVTTIIYKIVNENPIAPRDLDVSVHQGLSAIVIKMLAKAPEDRYQTGADMVRDLENYKLISQTLLNATASAGPSSQSLEKTVVLPMRVVSGSTVRIPAPETMPTKGPIPLRRPAAAALSGKRSGLITVIVIILVLGFAMGGYAYYKTQIKMRQLQAEIKAKEAQAQAVQSNPVVSAAPTPANPASANPTKPVDGAEVATDVTVRHFSADPKPVHPQKATSSPNKVFSQQSEVKFTSQPTGAKVEVDGWSEPTWVTPFTASHLAAGTHTVVFSRTGYSQQTRSIQSVAGKSVDVSAQLGATGSTLVITSNPQGANIWVDGKDTGLNTPSQLTVEKGQHKITVRKSGFKDGSTEEDLSEGETFSFSPVLLSVDTPSDEAKGSSMLRRFFGADTIPEGKGLVHIRTHPEGATIMVDGRAAPKKTNAKWPADPGVYSIVLQLDGYKPVHRNVKLQKGKIVNVDEILERQ
jgi:serine/threonine-protein kinase